MKLPAQSVSDVRINDRTNLTRAGQSVRHGVVSPSACATLQTPFGSVWVCVSAS
jgi:hypothetical protein